MRKMITATKMTMSLVFFHHIARLRAVERRLNANDAWFKLSVLSTKMSIRSPLSSTFSVHRSWSGDGDKLIPHAAFTNVMNHDILYLVDFTLHLPQFIRTRVRRVEFLEHETLRTFVRCICACNQSPP